MTPDQLKQIQTALIETVKVTVNGKIDRLNDVLSKHISDDAETAKKLDLHLDSDAIWKKNDATYKETIAPVIKVGQRAIGWGETTFWAATFFGTIGTLIVMFIDLIKKVK